MAKPADRSSRPPYRRPRWLHSIESVWRRCSRFGYRRGRWGFLAAASRNLASAIVGLIQAIVGEAPIDQQVCGGRFQVGGLLKFGDGEIEAALLLVGEGKLEVGPHFAGRFEGGVLPEERAGRPRLRRARGWRRRPSSTMIAAMPAIALRSMLEAAEQIDGNQNQPERMGRYMRRSAMGSLIGRMLDVGASRTRKTK